MKRSLKVIAPLVFVSALSGCATFLDQYMVKDHTAFPEKETVFIGKANDRFNSYTRTTVTLEPYKERALRRLSIASYPAPKQVYVSCSNFGQTDLEGKTLAVSEHRVTYIRKYDFKPGKFYQFICTRPNDLATQDYQIEMKEYDAMPTIKSAW